jgi:hypothetical protein
MLCELLKIDAFDPEAAFEVVRHLREDYPDSYQFSVTNEHNDDDLFSSVGRIDSGRITRFTKLHSGFKNTVIQQIVDTYPEYYRWRLLTIDHRNTYSVHRDGVSESYTNTRIHAPIVSNDESYMMFYEHAMEKAQGNEPYAGQQRIKYYQLTPGNLYRVDTTNYHSAVNYHGSLERLHLVGEKYDEVNK